MATKCSVYVFCSLSECGCVHETGIVVSVPDDFVAGVSVGDLYGGRGLPDSLVIQGHRFLCPVARQYFFQSDRRQLFVVPVPGYEANNFEGKAFGRQKIYIDGNHYKNCSFDGSILVYGAVRGVTLEKCGFSETQWVFVGPARRALMLLSALSRGGFSDVVETTIAKVKAGTYAP